MPRSIIALCYKPDTKETFRERYFVSEETPVVGSFLPRYGTVLEVCLFAPSGTGNKLDVWDYEFFRIKFRQFVISREGNYYREEIAYVAVPIDFEKLRADWLDMGYGVFLQERVSK